MKNNGEGFFQKDSGMVLFVAFMVGLVGLIAFAIADGKPVRIYNSVMFNHYIEKAQGHLAHFDTNSAKREGGLEKDLSEIQLAAESIMEAENYGTPPIEISSDIFDKMKAYKAAAEAKSKSSLQNSIDKYDKFWSKFSDLVEKRNKSGL